MLISEVTGKSIEDNIRERREEQTSQFVLKGAMDIIISKINERLNNKAPLNELSTIEKIKIEIGKITRIYINPNDENINDIIMQALEDQGIKIEPGTGKITKGEANDVDITDPEKEKERNKTQKIGQQAMSNLQKKSDKSPTL